MKIIKFLVNVIQNMYMNQDNIKIKHGYQDDNHDQAETTVSEGNMEYSKTLDHIGKALSCLFD